MSTVRTVLGDVEPEALGVCDAHDHLFLNSPRLPGQELDDEQAAAEELAEFRKAGGRAVVQWTPYGMGRPADMLAELSEQTGVTLIAATGLHQVAHYDRELLDGVRDRLADTFVSELTRGIRGGPRAGMVKVAGGFHGLDAHARKTMTAAARAHHETGAPIGVHLELGTAALDVLDLLCGDLAVPPSRVILGHLNRSPDLRTQKQAAEAGAFLAFDGPSRANHATDWRLLDSLTALVEAGHADQLLIGGDTTTAEARSVRGGPGLPYLLARLRPAIEREIGEATATGFFVQNPARAFQADW
ncbi:hypothetical protein [Actinomadura sp. DC4]|uniref:phosphotriesterase family protein n=1 Tax=Actinomadura sp. DC4 TaxID=3055069 RepID=UPI0025AF06F5|nr:hypothetical protein [Actinomadura sp. DC4]MDN3360089.1 hypothetical protein [Actinomadura sp. DC4]